MASPITVVEATKVSDGLEATIGRLVVQLSATAPALSSAHLEAIVASPASRLLLATEENTVVGMLTLVTVPVPTGMRGFIEDVVVDQAAAAAASARR